MITIQIDSRELNTAIENINKLEAKIKGRVQKEVVNTAARIDKKAKLNTPVITGRLRSSIHFETEQTPSYNYSDNKGNSYDGKLDVSIGPFQASVGTNVEYAIIVHEGGKGRSANRFLFNAAESERQGFNRRTIKILKSA